MQVFDTEIKNISLLIVLSVQHNSKVLLRMWCDACLQSFIVSIFFWTFVCSVLLSPLYTTTFANTLHFSLVKPCFSLFFFFFWRALSVSPETHPETVCRRATITILVPKNIGNRKRDCAGCAGVKKLKKNQLLSTNHHQAKQIWVLMICAQQLIFLQLFNTRASSRTISFSISNSFWY